MSFENVVLSYQHPHVAVFVEDNTGYTETFLEEEEPVKLIQCGAFSQGRDNKLIYCKTPDEFLSEFGNPNFKLYGQAGYNVIRALRTGYAGAYVIRVMPDDATYANVILMIRYKVIENADTGVKKLSVAYTSQTIEGATSIESIKTQVKALSTSDPDDDGYYTRPLLAVYSTGRGVYGNALRFRIADITNYDDDYVEYKDYRFDVLAMEDTLVRKEYALGSLDFNLFDNYNEESLFLEDLINDQENGLGKVNVIFNNDLYEELIDLYNTQVIGEDDTELTSSTFDILYGRTMTGEDNPNITFQSIANQVSFRVESDGISLYSGSDGEFALDSETRDDAIEAQLVKAYSGELDRYILSTFSTPADFMLDANFPETVKRAMAALAMRRQYDCTCYLDSGLLDSVNETLYWLKHISDISDPNIVKECHHYTYRDREFTGKAIPVTTTYFLAGIIPTHFKTFGLGTPIAMSNARITEAVAGSFLPVIDPDDNDIKKEFYRLRGNYYETVKYNVFQRGTAINTQAAVTDRMDEFNNYILNLAVRTARNVMYGHIYNFAEENDRARYQETTNKIMDYTLGQYVRSCSVAYEMSKDDERRNILRLKLRIVFRTVVKRGIVEIYLDPRVSNS